MWLSGDSAGHADKSHYRRMQRCLLSGGIETIAGSLWRITLGRTREKAE